MFFTDWEQYLNNLAAANKKLQHGVNGKRAFIPFGTDESPVANSKLGSPYMVHTAFYGAGNKETLWVFTSELLFLYSVSTTKGKLEEQVQEARQKAFELMSEFDARFMEDFNNGDSCELLEDWYEPSAEPVDFTDQASFGWKYTIRLAAARNVYDETKWEE